MSARTIRRREHGKGTQRRRLHLCSARMAPPRSKLLASPFPGFYFCRCNFIFENNHALHVHRHIYFFFSLPSPRLIAHGNGSDGRANLPVCSAQQQLGIQVLVTPCLGMKAPTAWALYTVCTFQVVQARKHTHKVTSLCKYNSKKKKKK